MAVIPLKFPPPSRGRVRVGGLLASRLSSLFLGHPPSSILPLEGGGGFICVSGVDKICAWPTRTRVSYVRTKPRRKSGSGRNSGVNSWTARDSDAKSRWGHTLSISSVRTPSSSSSLMAGSMRTKSTPMRVARRGCKHAATQLSGFGTTIFSKTLRASWRRYPAIFGSADLVTRAPSLALPLEGGGDVTVLGTDNA